MLVAFDFDGTLSDSEMTVLLGDRCGAADEMAAITERAMNDEIGYATSLRERAALLEGLSATEAAEAYARVELRPGAADVVDALRGAGHTVAVLTGGFESGVAAALDDAGVEVDAVVANRLPVDGGDGDLTGDDGDFTGGDGDLTGGDGELTGEVEGPLVEGTKDDALESLAAEEGYELADAVAVGDGANDLPMLEVAGLAVGFAPKPAVEPRCDVVVESMVELHEVLVEREILPESS